MNQSFTDRYLAAIKATEPPAAPSGEPVIEIHGPLRHLTAFYERVRTLIDYQDERFIRRLAIRRILFRRILIQGERDNFGELLIRELIRAAYIENGKYPLSTAKTIDKMLEKYLTTLPTIERRYPPTDLVRMERRILGIAAAEIEDYLNPADVDRVLVEELSHEMTSYLGSGAVTDQIRIVAMRGLLKADSELVAWRLFIDRTAETSAGIWKKFTADPADHIGEVIREIMRLELSLQDRQIDTQMRRFSQLIPPYTILADLARQHETRAATLVAEPNRLDVTLETLVGERIERVETKIQRSMVRATIYIFLTKIVIGVALEVPYDLATHGKIAYLPLGINVLIPPTLMLLAALGIHPPGRENTDLLVLRAKKILLNETLPALTDIHENRQHGSVANAFFSLFYFATYAIAFGGLIWILNLLHFNFVSILIFLFFLSIVGFFAFRIRTTAKELAVIREREGFLLLVFDFFALPFLQVGRWLSVTIRQMNIILFVLDFIIEAPLKIVFVAIEDWFAFLREKREELG